jgi:hypothetical protein
MLNQFLLPTIIFMIHVLSALAAFMMSWVIWDAASATKKNRIKLTLALGFLLLGVNVLFLHSFEYSSPLQEIFQSTYLLSLTLIFFAYYVEATPMLSLKSKGKKELNLYNPSKILSSILFLPFVLSLVFLFGKIAGFDLISQWPMYFDFIAEFFIFLIFALLFLKLYVGNQRQLSYMFFGFFSFLIANSFMILGDMLLQDLRFDFWTGDNGMFLILENLFIFLAFMSIGFYGYSFLRFRMKPQLFINFVSYSLLVFFTVTVVFLLVLLKDFENNTLFNLKSSSKAVEISIVELKNDSILAAKALVNDEALIRSLDAEDRDGIARSIVDIFEASGADFISVTNEGAVSLYETSNPETFGTSFSNDRFLTRALEGVPTSTIGSEDGLLAPVITAKTYLPVVKDGKVLGALVVGFIVDDQFVDNLKQRTGLELTLFAKNVRSATTFTSDNGVQRLSGTLEENPEVIKAVLEQGLTFEGTVDIFNVNYLSVYTPLKDDDENIIGMIFVGEPSKILLAIANQSVQTTLKWMSFLVLLSLIPAYIFAKRSVMSQMV